MKTLSITTLWMLALVTSLLAAPEDTWIAPRMRAQLAMDPTLIPKGKGLLFVPAMSAGYREPNFQVFQHGKKVASAEPGSGVLLNPGTYDLLIGSGTIAQMMRRPVKIVENYTTLVKPWWSGLIVDVIDETRTSVKKSYELFDEKQENFGVGYGVEEERGEAVDTWLLRPGVYNIVKVGENVATTHKFSVRLLPGELVQRNLVINNQDDFVGFYPPSYLQQASRSAASPWSSRWELSMSPQFSTTQNSAGEDRSSLSFAGEIRNRTRYVSRRHMYDLRFILDEGFTKEGGEALRKSVDEVEVRTTYILRVSRRLGPYLRGVVNSKLFATDIHFSKPRDLVIRNADHEVIEVRHGITQFQQEPSFYPLELREGVGISSQLLRSFPLNIDLRFGLGARQTYYVDAYEMSQDLSTATQLRDASSSGLETLLIMDARLGKFISLDSELDLLMPSSNADSWEFTFENRIRTFLTPFVNMDIVLDFERQKPLNRLQSTQQVLLRLVKFF